MSERNRTNGLDDDMIQLHYIHDYYKENNSNNGNNKSKNLEKVYEY